MGDVASARKLFNSNVAPHLAAEIGISSPWSGNGSARFSYFASDKEFLVVAGPQEGGDVDLALALGLSYRRTQQLVLALPASHAFATFQRSAFLEQDVRPIIFTHHGRDVSECEVPEQDAAVGQLHRRLAIGQTPRDELRQASTALHLADRFGMVELLTEWATQDPRLDPAHRQAYRAWHHMGQSVLSIRRTRRGVAIRAGIDARRSSDVLRLEITGDDHLDQEQLEACCEHVELGILSRNEGPYRRPDEHWLQAVIRRDPSLAGIEQPALREVPAWRPSGGVNTGWSRGYIDLLGLDGDGNIRVVETKLAGNRDDMLILQGLDYYAWSIAYRDALRDRLGAAEASELIVSYVVGSKPNGDVRVSRHAQAHVDALSPTIRRTFCSVSNWFTDPGEAIRPEVTKIDLKHLPCG